MERKALFEKGDIVLNLKRTEPRLILDVITENDTFYRYRFMHLKDQSLYTIAGEDISFKKGDTGTQPCDIVEKHFSIYKIE
jgi:hypothetical protein